jgi:hypothetical protein
MKDGNDFNVIQHINYNDIRVPKFQKTKRMVIHFIYNRYGTVFPYREQYNSR